MALCYLAVSCNGTRDQIYGIFPTREAAFECLKKMALENDVDDDDPDCVPLEDATTIEGLRMDAKIVEIKDGGEEISIEIHEW